MENPLKKKRIELGLKVEDISEKSGLSIKTIRAYESAYRNPSAKDMFIIAEIYKLTNEEIVEWLKYINYKTNRKDV